jgi:hypothetical protein
LRHHAMNKRTIIIIASIVVVIAAAVLYYFLSRPGLEGRIAIPFIAHQKPAIDPHLPNANALSDKLDEVQFDGLFNLSANPSGVVYEDGLGELVGVDQDNVVSIRLKQGRRWHDSYPVTMDGDDITVGKGPDHLFSSRDLEFTLKRIQSLGTLSPDYILVSQAVDNFAFEGPDADNIIRFRFRGDRIWKEADIKEILSFKILPEGSSMNELNYRNGTGAYLSLPPKEGVANYFRMPGGPALIPFVDLMPFIDNSTYPTEMKAKSINVLLDTPFGSVSPVLANHEEFFTKSNISTTFFALLFNTERLNREQRRELRRVIDARLVLDRFFKVNTPQQRNIMDYKGNTNNYADHVNASIFPSSSYYLEEKIIEPVPDSVAAFPGILPDTVQIQVCLNYGAREEYSELISILNTPGLFGSKLHVTAVTNDVIRKGNYDAVLVAFTGYRSNFLFDLYDIFLREPDLETYKINLQTALNADGTTGISPASLQADHNFFRLDARRDNVDQQDVLQFMSDMYAFMSSRQVGDKQEYARRVDAMERQLCLGKWLFSLPSLAYFSTQFDSSSIDLYGVASQLSTIKKWKEREKK